MTPPKGYQLVDSILERVQAGDLIYDREDEEWLPPARAQLGEFSSTHIARPVPQPGRKRIMRSRRKTA